MTRVGDVLASKYRLEELLGSGGMGHVYRATNELVGRAVAIKVLRSEHATNGPIVERFLREARAANLVRHPNVVDVLDIGRDGDGSPFIVQELLKGQDLSKFIESRGGKLTLAEIENYFLPVVDAVAEAHARGVVHRDIKPENVFLAEEGKKCVPKLLDFGISKIRLPDVRATEVGVMMGTPAYMAPEQIQGARDADARTDVWALGIMLFELLAGRLPFDAEDAPAMFVAIATKDVPSLLDRCPGVSADVSRVAGRCLRRLPDERYPSALELARDLRHVLAGTEIEPTQKLSMKPPPRARSPHLEIPDLDLPTRRAAPAPPRAAKTISDAPTASGLALGKTELSTPRPAPESIPRSAGVPDLETRPHVAPPASRAIAPAPLPSAVPASPSRSSTERASAPQPASPHAPVKPHATAGVGKDESLAGFMLGPGSHPTNPRRAQAGAGTMSPSQRAVTTADMSVLVGLAVVGLTAIGSTAVLMSIAHQTEGIQLVQYVTKPTPTLNLVAHGGLAVVGFVVGSRFAKGAMERWRGDVIGGRGAAVFNAIVAGAFFFAAIELARAAF